MSDIVREGHHLALGALTVEGLAPFVATRLGSQPPPPLLDALSESTAGNPFFASELLRLHWLRGNVFADDHPEVRSNVRQTIRSRLALLPPRTVEVLHTAAVLGREFDIVTLANVVNRPPAELGDELDGAVRAAVLRQTDRGFVFTHGSIRETLYEDLRTTVRASLHARVLEVLEGLDLAGEEDRLSELAHHAVEAATAGADRAISYAQRAAEVAMARLAFEEAVRHCERALRAADLSAAGTRTRLDLLLALAAARGAAGDIHGAREAAVSAAGVARSAQDAQGLARAALTYPYTSAIVYQADEPRIALLREALDDAPADDHALRATLLTQLVIDECYLDDMRARRSAEAALTEARASGDPRVRAAAIMAQGVAAGYGPVADEAPELQEGLDLARQLDDPVLEAAFLFRVAYRQLELGLFDQLDATISMYTQLAERLRRPVNVWWAMLMRAMRLLYDGRYSEAQEAVNEAGTYGFRVAGGQSLSTFGVQSTLLSLEIHPWDDLLEDLRQLPEDFRRRPACRAGMAWLEAAVGDPDVAAREVAALSADDFGLLPRDRSRHGAIANLTNAVLSLGDTDVAERLVEMLGPYQGRIITGSMFAAMGAFDRDRGRLLALLGRLDDAERAMRDALDLVTRTGGRPWAAHTHRDLAGVLLRLGRDADARAHLHEALSTAQKLGMTQLEVVVRDDLAILGAVAAAPAETSGYSAGGDVTICREGEYWTITSAHGTARLRDSKGLRYLARLLANPGVEIHALELVSEVGPSAGVARPKGLDSGGFGDVEPALDAPEKAAYGRRLDDLRADIDEADSFNDPERAARAREEYDFLVAALSRAVRLGGRDRPQRAADEQARVNVTKAIRTALRRVREHDPNLADRLAPAIRTGTFCCYQPLAGAHECTVLTQRNARARPGGSPTR